MKKVSSRKASPGKRRIRKVSIRQRIQLVLFGLFLCVVLLEIGLRIGGFIFLFQQERRNITAIKEKGAYRIMCLGESTTAGGTDAYPHQLEISLNLQNIGVRFDVINKGFPGINTTIILERLTKNLDDYKPDMVIAMMGINDEMSRLHDEGRFIIYKESPIGKIISFFQSFRICKLASLLQQCLANKVQIIKLAQSKKKNAAKRYDLSLEIMKADQENVIEDPEEAKLKDKRYLDYIDVGRRYRYSEEYDIAEKIFERIIADNPKYIQTYLELNECYYMQEQHDKMVVLLENAMKQADDVSDIRPYLELGRFYRLEGKHIKSREMFIKAIKKAPHLVLPYVELGRSYREQGKYVKAVECLKESIAMNPKWDRGYAALALHYQDIGKDKKAALYFNLANKLRLESYSAVMRDNYLRLREILKERRIQLVCVQYPMRDLNTLKTLFDDKEGIVFVSNKNVFRDAIKKGSLTDYFTDTFAGDFGHCTAKGNRLLAKNIGDIILKERFKQ